MNQDIIEKIICESISLEEYGLNDLAWKKKDAIHLINSIMNDRIGILGGDVYKLKSNNLVPLYDNWYLEPLDFESEFDFYKRSKEESLTYINKYKLNLDDDVVFSITFTENIK